MRRQIGQRLRLRRTPEVTFEFDESIGHQDRVEQLLREIADAPTSAPVGATAGKPAAPDAPNALNAPNAPSKPDDPDER
jgi:hypothetical protein